MERVETDIDNLRTSVFELKSSLYRADRAQIRDDGSIGLRLGINVTATFVLALFFLLI
ncbi:hypothetical protein [Cohaesibacter sp. ES.047]|uniref:hypothetical protein n=1 Tax=Cohaesibacter sp. ES.047 TaxID=1798205 RepID=UPI0012FD9E0E|nr:hypothetical protein [Cohaesibacter sp. ES.047]